MILQRSVPRIQTPMRRGFAWRSMCFASRGWNNNILGRRRRGTYSHIWNLTVPAFYLRDKRRSLAIIPRKAALQLTPKAREVFQKLIAVTSSEGIMLKYERSQQALGMVFKLDLIKDVKKELNDRDEGVSLEVLEDGSPKPPAESWDDNLPKLYVASDAFMKVLGGKVDVEFDATTGVLKPKLFNREGH